MPADPAARLLSECPEEAWAISDDADRVHPWKHGSNEVGMRAGVAAVAAEAERRQRAADLALCVEELGTLEAHIERAWVGKSRPPNPERAALRTLRARLLARLGPEAPTREER